MSIPTLQMWYDTYLLLYRSYEARAQQCRADTIMMERAARMRIHWFRGKGGWAAKRSRRQRRRLAREQIKAQQDVMMHETESLRQAHAKAVAEYLHGEAA